VSVRTGKPQSKAAVIKTYLRVVAASGFSASELGTPKMTENRSPSNYGNAWDFLDLSASRYYKGIPYANQAVSISVQAVTGAVDLWEADFGPAPVSDRQNITKHQAIELGKQFMTDRQIVGAFTGCSLAIEQPNSQFRDTDSDLSALSAPPVIAWDCGFGDPNGWNTHLWFAAADGTYIGGSQEGHVPTLNRP
jgi:hypothetical protein